MSIEGQGHFFTIYIFPGFVCFVLFLAKISGERLQDHWSSGIEISISVCQVSVWCGRVTHPVSLHRRRSSSGGDQGHHSTVCTLQQHIYL